MFSKKQIIAVALTFVIVWAVNKWYNHTVQPIKQCTSERKGENDS